jgi:histidine triad (HIT) family protein
VSGCLFCRIASGEIPADVVLRNNDVVAFRDVNPQAPVHVLVIPIEHHANVTELSAKAPHLTSKLIDAAAAVAQGEGLDNQYRLVFNTGADVGQSVFHVHAHVLGGRNFAWPPG